MPTNIRIIHAHDFIKATVKGELDLKEAMELLIRVATTSAPLVDYELLLDIRNAQAKLSITELWFLAAELGKLNKGGVSRKIAVLCPLTEFDHAGFFALCAQNRGMQVQAFTSFEDAIEWLIGSAA